jgi:lipoprotein-anchoring transpeptidase ErfK/SrfK
MRRRTANRKRSNNRIPQSTLFALALALSAAATSAQIPAKPPGEPRSSAGSDRRIIVSIPDRKLALIENNRVVKIYDAAVGAPASASPSGEFQITERLENPTYYSPGVVIEPGAGNPLGTGSMGLNIKGFGIHGTNSPDSIGHNASHGSIRLRNREVEELFLRLKVGDRVSVIAERTDEVAQIFGPAPGSSSTQTQAARNEVRFPSADEPGGDR